MLFCNMHEIICTCYDADALSMLLQKAQDRLPSVSWNTSTKLIGYASNEMPLKGPVYLVHLGVNALFPGEDAWLYRVQVVMLPV
jgi:hypothetical protein